MTCYRTFHKNNKMGATTGALTEHMISPRVVRGARVAQPLVFVLSLVEHCLSYYYFSYGVFKRWLRHYTS